MGDRTILHCDLNGFYASVECLLNPRYRDVPMAVAGNPENRHGIILAKNELAKKYGVKTAETIWQARQKCPDLVLAPPHRDEYVRFSKLVNRIYGDYTDLCEPFGIDESWLDVTGVRHLFGDGEQIAATLRERIRSELGLTISVGVSFNKIFAKLGSDYKKPDATTVILRENYKSILWPLPVDALLFVGRSAKETLNKMYITTIGQLAQSDREYVSRRLGKLGEMIHDYANGLDDSPVRPASGEHDMKSVGNGMTFRRNLIGIEDIRTAVGHLAEEVAGRMRRYGVKCRTIAVTIRDPNFRTISRQTQMEIPTYLARDLREASLSLIRRGWNLRAPIRMLTITAASLVDADSAAEQTSLFEDNGARQKQERLEATVAKLRDRFGKDAVEPGNLLKNDLGIE